MRPRLLRTLVVLAALVMPTAPQADLGKLDRRARVALQAIRDGGDRAHFGGRGLAVDVHGDLDVFIGGALSREALETAGARVRSALPGRFTASVPAGAIERVAALGGVDRIQGAAPLDLELEASVPAIGVSVLRGAGPVFAGANGAGILIGSVDSGVDFGHGDFLTPAGATRLIRIWDQAASPTSPPAGFDYGTEWTSAQIDAGQCTQTDPVGHGTHVLGIAGGDGSQTGGAIPAHTYTGVAPRADLAMVKSNFTDTGIIDGVRYLFDLATARGQSAVVNISLGGHYGPHDGTSFLESMLASLTGPGRIIVKSAGNDRANFRHAEVRAATGLTATMMVSGSFVGAVFTVVGTYESTENLSLQIRTPNGTLIGPLSRGATQSELTTSNGTVYVENGVTTTGGGDYEVLLDVTAGGGQNMNGEWAFVFAPVALGAAGGEVDLWRAGSNVTAPWQAGAQAEELVSEPGNAGAILAVGAWITKKTWVDCNGATLTYGSGPTLGALAGFSSPGPTRDGRLKPDLVAPGQGIVSTTDFDVFPFCGSNSVYLGDGLSHRIDQGTSMAAPHAAGVVALLLQSYGPLSPAQVRDHLAAHAVVDGFTGAVPNNDWGQGKLFLDRSVPTLVSLFQAAWVPEGVEVRWRLMAGVEAMATVLERSGSDAGPWQRVEAVPRPEGDVVVAIDRSLPGRGTYYYRIEVRGAGGEIVILGPLRVDFGEGRLEELLGPVRPNPSRGMVRVDFALPRPTSARLSVLDLQGREIAILADGPHRAGHYQAAWGSTRGERPAPAGLYFVSLTTSNHRRTQRLVITP